MLPGRKNFFAYAIIISKLKEKIVKKYRTTLNTHKLTCFQNLELLWQCSISAKKRTTLFLSNLIWKILTGGRLTLLPSPPTLPSISHCFSRRLSPFQIQVLFCILYISLHSTFTDTWANCSSAVERTPTAGTNFPFTEMFTTGFSQKRTCTQNYYNWLFKYCIIFTTTEYTLKKLQCRLILYS